MICLTEFLTITRVDHPRLNKTGRYLRIRFSLAITRLVMVSECTETGLFDVKLKD